MRTKRVQLGDIFKSGIASVLNGSAGLSDLCNIKPSSQGPISCPTETVVKVAADCTPFTLGTTDYRITSTGIFELTETLPEHVKAFSGRLKIVNFIEVVWIQDSVSTYFMDRAGLYTVNPSGNTIPLCNDIQNWDGQVICAGILDGSLSLNEGFVLWGDIGKDSFDLDRQNIAGFSNPDIGAIKSVLLFDNSAMLLGDRGTSLMRQAEQTMGFKSRPGPAIRGVGLAASCGLYGIYVSVENCLILVKPDGTYEELGYRWLMPSITAVRYLPRKDWFLLDTATESYIIEKGALYRLGAKIYGESNIGLIVPSSFAQLTYSFKTTDMNFNRPGLKNLLEVTVQDGLPASDVRSVSVCNETSLSNGEKVLNSQSSTKYPIWGATLSVEYTSSSPPSISEFSVEMGFIDRRFGTGSTYEG